MSRFDKLLVQCPLFFCKSSCSIRNNTKLKTKAVLCSNNSVNTRITFVKSDTCTIKRNTKCRLAINYFVVSSIETFLHSSDKQAYRM